MTYSVLCKGQLCDDIFLILIPKLLRKQYEKALISLK